MLIQNLQISQKKDSGSVLHVRNRKTIIHDSIVSKYNPSCRGHCFNAFIMPEVIYEDRYIMMDLFRGFL